MLILIECLFLASLLSSPPFTAALRRRWGDWWAGARARGLSPLLLLFFGCIVLGGCANRVRGGWAPLGSDVHEFLNGRMVMAFSTGYFVLVLSGQPVVALLLGAKAAVNQATTDGVSPLCAAAQEGHVESVRLLLAAGAAVNNARNDGASPLFAAHSVPMLGEKPSCRKIAATLLSVAGVAAIGGADASPGSAAGSGVVAGASAHLQGSLLAFAAAMLDAFYKVAMKKRLGTKEPPEGGPRASALLWLLDSLAPALCQP